jgi:hypothetical protein
MDTPTINGMEMMPSSFRRIFMGLKKELLNDIKDTLQTLRVVGVCLLEFESINQLVNNDSSNMTGISSKPH